MKTAGVRLIRSSPVFFSSAEMGFARPTEGHHGENFTGRSFSYTDRGRGEHRQGWMHVVDCNIDVCGACGHRCSREHPRPELQKQCWACFHTNGSSGHSMMLGT